MKSRTTADLRVWMDAAIVAVFALCSLGLLLSSMYYALRTGTAYWFSLNDIAHDYPWLIGEPLTRWVLSPGDWIGAHRLLTPIPGFCWAVLAAGIAGAPLHDALWDRATRRIGMVTALALLLTGCSLPTMTRADMTAFDRDHYECYREASFPQSSVMALPGAGGGLLVGGSGVSTPAHSRPGQNLYRLCMKARGYRAAD